MARPLPRRKHEAGDRALGRRRARRGREARLGDRSVGRRPRVGPKGTPPAEPTVAAPDRHHHHHLLLLLLLPTRRRCPRPPREPRPSARADQGRHLPASVRWLTPPSAPFFPPPVGRRSPTPPRQRASAGSAGTARSARSSAGTTTASSATSRPKRSVYASSLLIAMVRERASSAVKAVGGWPLN